MARAQNGENEIGPGVAKNNKAKNAPAQTREPSKERPFALLNILTRKTDENHGLSLVELGSELEMAGYPAERKAIARDLHLLERMGYDIEAVHTGRQVDYRLARHAFTDTEAQLIANAVQSSQALTNAKSNQIIEHLMALLSEHQQKRVHRRILVAGRVRHQDDSVFDKLDPLYAALEDRRFVRFKYYEYDAHGRRVPRAKCDHEVSPMHIVYSEGFYYLVAYAPDSDSVRHYRIDHMGSIAEVPERHAARAQAIDDYDTSDTLSRAFSMFQGESARVKLRVRTPLVRSVIDKFGDTATITPDEEDGWAIATGNVLLGSTFYGWVAQFGDGMEIIAPTRAREGMVAQLAACTSLYENDAKRGNVK